MTGIRGLSVEGPGIWRLSGGLRVFGWTHIYNVPYLVHWLETNGVPDVEKPAVPVTHRRRV